MFQTYFHIFLSAAKSAFLNLEHFLLRGGMDGGDGGASDYHTRGGRGSGLDLGMMVMGHFNLAPGRGGNVAGGGGGGGVLVNGGGPDPGFGAGQGYGGGGSHSDDFKKGGSTGCVLLELI